MTLIKVLFSLQFDYPDNITIDNVFAGHQKYVVVDIQNNDIKKLDNSSNNLSNSYSLIKLKIPKSLLTDIENINATVVSPIKGENTHDITDYLLNDTSSKYHELSIPIPNDSITTTLRINGGEAAASDGGGEAAASDGGGEAAASDGGGEAAASDGDDDEAAASDGDDDEAAASDGDED